MPWQQKEGGGASWYPASHPLQQNEALRDRDLRKCPAITRIDAKKASISIHLRARSSSLLVDIKIMWAKTCFSIAGRSGRSTQLLRFLLLRCKEILSRSKRSKRSRVTTIQ